MFTNMEIVIAFLFLVGTAMISFGFMFYIEQKIKTLSLPIFGAIMISFSIFLGDINTEKKEDILADQVALMLNTKPNSIIIEDMSEEGSFFRKSKNENLRRVHHNGESYIIEIKDNKVKRFVSDTKFSSASSQKNN